jgi:hypothetical protein
VYDPDTRPATAEAHPPTVPLHERTDLVNQRLEQLDKLASLLEQRLEPVLRPSRPSPAVIGAVEPDRSDSGSWLADYLAATTKRLDSSLAGLAELLERIEL